jgi:hypothetical protein
MVQTVQPRHLTADEVSLIGRLLFETLAGEIKQTTWDALYTLGNLREIPEPFDHIISFAQGYALDNKSLARELQDEVRIIVQQLAEQHHEQPDARSGAWISMYALLEAMLEGGDYSLRDNAEYLPEPEQVPAWAAPLIKHAKGSTTNDKELTLHLLEMLEAQIQKRRAELLK